MINLLVIINNPASIYSICMRLKKNVICICVKMFQRPFFFLDKLEKKIYDISFEHLVYIFYEWKIMINFIYSICFLIWSRLLLSVLSKSAGTNHIHSFLLQNLSLFVISFIFNAVTFLRDQLKTRLGWKIRSKCAFQEIKSVPIWHGTSVLILQMQDYT